MNSTSEDRKGNFREGGKGHCSRRFLSKKRRIREKVFSGMKCFYDECGRYIMKAGTVCCSGVDNELRLRDIAMIFQNVNTH